MILFKNIEYTAWFIILSKTIDAVVTKHVTVILLLINIIDAHCFISNKTKLAVLDKAQEYRSQKSIAKSCLVSSMT